APSWRPPRRASCPRTTMTRTSLIVSSNARRHASVSTWLLNRNRALSEGRSRQRRAAQNEQERICRRRGRERHADTGDRPISHVRAHLCTWMFPSLIRLSGTSSNGTGGGGGGGTIGVCHIVTWIVSLFLPGSPLSVTFTSKAHSVPLQRPFPWNMAEFDPNSTSNVTGPFTCRPVVWLT